MLLCFFCLTLGSPRKESASLMRSYVSFIGSALTCTRSISSLYLGWGDRNSLCRAVPPRNARCDAFRGGTALHKLFLSPQPRYSEDIDLVQVKAEPIKETYDRIREALSFLGEPKVKQKKHNNTLIFRLESEIIPVVPIHLKVEINCKEHFNVLPMQEVPFSVSNKWYNGECHVLTYQLDELVGTKLRALYQRRKGRDLYDLYKALTLSDVNIAHVLACYQKYMEFVVDHVPTYKEFIINMEDKMQDDEFLGDTKQLLRPDEEFNPHKGYEVVRTLLIDRLQK